MATLVRSYPTKTCLQHFRILTARRVSFGIMIGFVFNLIFAAIVQTKYGDNDKGRDLTVALILGAPLIFAVAMLGAVLKCTESPRYYMRGGQASRKYEPKKAYEILQKLRSCKVSASRQYAYCLVRHGVHESWSNFSCLAPCYERYVFATQNNRARDSGNGPRSQ